MRFSVISKHDVHFIHVRYFLKAVNSECNPICRCQWSTVIRHLSSRDPLECMYLIQLIPYVSHWFSIAVSFVNPYTCVNATCKRVSGESGVAALRRAKMSSCLFCTQRIHPDTRALITVRDVWLSPLSYVPYCIIRVGTM